MKLTPLDLFSGQYKETEKTIRENLKSVFSHLGIANGTSGEIINKIFEVCASNRNMSEVESDLRKLIKLHKLGEKVNEKLEVRSSQVYNQIKNYVKGKFVLDLGCGNGKVGEALNKDGFKVRLMDSVDYNKSSLPLELYNGDKIPAQTSSIDTTLLLMVLHHCDNPISVLEEAVRVTSKRLIVIESIFISEEERRFNIFMDWFYNRIFSYENVNVPLNFRTPSEWEKLFLKYFKSVKSIDLGIDLPICPEHHWLFILDK